ncbi:hypothetical protein FF1_006217 [Malus domestica]
MKVILVIVSLLLFNSLLLCYSIEDNVACLEGVKSSFTDLEGRLSQWDLANRLVTSICKLVGVTCWNEKENRLISLQLPSILQSLDLFGNSLSGSIPPQICNWLPYLVTLDVSGNSLFGSIPPEIANCKFLNTLILNDNRLSGTMLNLSHQMAALEGTKAAYCTSSGMSTISSILLQLVNSGEHIVASRTVYGGTHALMSHFFPRACNITTTFVDINDMDMVKNAIEAGKTKVLYFEGMSNLTLIVANIPKLSCIGYEKGVKIVVDNIFSLMVLSPVKLGADVVVHSISKFISGGVDIIAGVVCGPANLVNSMMDLHKGSLMLLGPTMNVNVAFELFERIPHLGLRMKEHYHRAMVYA